MILAMSVIDPPSEPQATDDHAVVLPTGTVTFLLTDLERSTHKWEAE